MVQPKNDLQSKYMNQSDNGTADNKDLQSNTTNQFLNDTVWVLAVRSVGDGGGISVGLVEGVGVMVLMI